ncbi:glycoside-pentoside-hexuronide (GPH):cation symporter [Paenibacillus sp. LHD-38]|uniref:MFS transporter n=1 Tax=Paenibacillus sp. LHD-38 TaxID=3072143 RepID=UPI0028102A65|nr:glycoside-pentoside-hexuronide (GPH):cation symporter [Paenibacillus sp. LHD-38]MDQ8737248.1 glycoside-pentoside-hexuronide (GPH):cation symporter [Paenibacillus sp. LHD-38]
MEQTAKLLEKTEAPAIQGIRKFGIRDKVGYMFGDVGNDLFFTLISGYLMLFYTDIYGISAATAGMILLVARILDALFDVAWGAYVDSRPVGAKGKFRPYLLYSAIPVTAFGILTFTYFPVAAGWQVFLATATYIIWGLAYSTINIPYGSLASVITSDPVERTSLSTFRTMGAILANVFIMTVAPIIIFGSGKTPTANGFVTIAIICAVLAIICYLSSYRLTVERIRTVKPASEKVNLLITVKGLFKNKALLGIMLASFGMMVSLMVVSAITPYLFKDYFKTPGLISIAGLIGLGSALLAMPLVSPLVKKYGKKESAVIGLIIAVVINFIMFVLPITSPYVYIGFYFVSSFGMAFLNILVWAMVSDCIDYQQFITGKREEGTVYSVYSLVRKIGQGVAGGLGGFALVAVGYNSGLQIQTEEAAIGIKSLITLIPALGSLIALVAIVWIYNLSKQRLVWLNEQLKNNNRL